MKLAGWLSAVMTYVVLTLAFFLVLTPLGLIRRLFGGDPLRRRRDRNTARRLIVAGRPRTAPGAVRSGHTRKPGRTKRPGEGRAMGGASGSSGTF